jgi:hypothetical protein
MPPVDLASGDKHAPVEPVAARRPAVASPSAIRQENQAASPGASIGQNNPAIFRNVRALKSRIRLPTITINSQVDTILPR